MATAARQPKPTRKGVPEPARRPAWTGARQSPTFSPPNSSPRPPNVVPPTSQGAFPPLGQTNGTRHADTPQDRVLQSLSGLTGTTITLLTRTTQRYEGVIASTSGEGDTTGVTLKDVKEISKPGAPIKDSLFIASTNIDTWSSGPADSAKVPNGDSFRTDTDISQKAGAGRPRELQAWQPSADTADTSIGGQAEDFTLTSSGDNNWNQFTANEKLFGVTTSFDEDVYTTKLDRTAPDYKERERKAQRIANEILGSATNNPHIAEERNQIVDDSGANEEDKYGAVVRGTNAYVPPGARRGGVASPPAGVAEVSKVSFSGPDGTNAAQNHSPASSSKAPSPAPASSNKPPADPLPAFRDFVTNEKQRLTQKRQALVKSEMDKRMADLIKFSQSFKLNKPIPDDLVPILAKDEEKQRAIREKSTKDAASTQARNIGVASSSSSVPAPPVPGVTRGVQPKQQPERKQALSSIPTPPTTKAKVPASAPTFKEPPVTAKPTNSMFIQPIPPFKGPSKSRQSLQPNPTNGSTSQTQPPARLSVVSVASNSGSQVNATSPMSPTTAAHNNRLNVNASSFRPTTKQSSPHPSGSNQSITPASASPKPKPESAASTPNPFFGTRPIKKSAPVHIKDDFNPFKHNKVADANAVAALWPYSGKRYIQMFPPVQHQTPQNSPHMAPPGPPPMPPPSYEEDAAARGYVYAYPPYGYPGQYMNQPMMQGMPPPGPPGAYMPGPFMQMHYPPGMPPPNQAMYASPGMGQMPPPQAYMQPPPPGAYPPPPNGAGPRPSMPPTPIPAHAHPYYHQSPQLQHAVPYPMMMQPQAPPHPYDGAPAPPVQMGGHA